ncbi:hypothetical protein LSAT2_001496, partial [Lamellibrachia satsuma]
VHPTCLSMLLLYFCPTNDRMRGRFAIMSGLLQRHRSANAAASVEVNRQANKPIISLFRNVAQHYTPSTDYRLYTIIHEQEHTKSHIHDSIVVSSIAAVAWRHHR